MRKILSIGVILFLVTTVGTTYAQEPPGDNFVLDWCFGNVFPDRAVWKCTWTDLFQVPLKIDEPFIVEQEEDQSAKETFMEMEKEIENIREVEEEPPQTEAEKMGLSEESFKALEEKKAEIESEKQKVIDQCRGGEEQAAAFQTRWQIEDVEKRLLSIEDWANLTTADRKLIAECRAIGVTKNWANLAYPGLEIEEFSGYTVANTDRIRIGIFATPEKMQKEHDRAVDYIKQFSWMRSIIEEPFASLRDPTETYQRDEAAIKHAEAIFEREKIESTEASIKQHCKTAWTQVGEGATTPEWWPKVLIDGTCDEHIPKLKDLLGDYYREEFANQTPQNCPDCERFQ